MNGTADDDEFRGDADTTSSADSLDGKAGTDTLKVFGTTTIPDTQNIEVFEFSAPAGDVDVSDESDVSTLVIAEDTADDDDYTVASGQSIELRDITAGGSNEDMDLVTGSMTSLDLTLNKVGTESAAVDVDAASADLTTLNVKGEGAASNVILTTNAGTLETVNVTGDQDIQFDADANNEAVTTVDASEASGDIAFTFDDDTGRAVTFTGGVGDDTVQLLTEFESNDSVDGGDGIDTLGVDIDEAAPATAPSNVANFEKLIVSGNISGADSIDAAKFGTTDGVKLTGTNTGSGILTINGLTSGATVATGASATQTNNEIDVDLDDATGTNDSLTFDYDTTTNDVAAITLDFTGIENVTLDASDSADGNGSDNEVFTLDAAQLETLSLQAGEEDIDLTSAELGRNVETVDASSTTAAGGVQLQLNQSAIKAGSVTGTANADTLIGSSQAGDTIDGGAGDDIIEGALGADTLTGGAGADTFRYADISDFGDTITDFESGSDKLMLDVGTNSTDDDRDTKAYNSDAIKDGFNSLFTSAFSGTDLVLASKLSGSKLVYTTADDDETTTAQTFIITDASDKTDFKSKVSSQVMTLDASTSVLIFGLNGATSTATKVFGVVATTNGGNTTINGFTSTATLVTLGDDGGIKASDIVLV